MSLADAMQVESSAGSVAALQAVLKQVAAHPRTSFPDEGMRGTAADKQRELLLLDLHVQKSVTAGLACSMCVEARNDDEASRPDLLPGKQGSSSVPLPGESGVALAARIIRCLTVNLDAARHLATIYDAPIAAAIDARVPMVADGQYESNEVLAEELCWLVFCSMRIAQHGVVNIARQPGADRCHFSCGDIEAFSCWKKHFSAVAKSLQSLLPYSEKLRRPCKATSGQAAPVPLVADEVRLDVCVAVVLAFLEDAEVCLAHEHAKYEAVRLCGRDGPEQVLDALKARLDGGRSHGMAVNPEVSEGVSVVESRLFFGVPVYCRPRILLDALLALARRGREQRVAMLEWRSKGGTAGDRVNIFDLFKILEDDARNDVGENSPYGTRDARSVAHELAQVLES
eukprot:TRINITY_DN124480_c0_g1_i1.p1 TRINITY_DN124480_c0_g1~~TRINITY_DN124480_c0_g1_i1.p1  ORF type:complete len:399 (+),score=64.86 TRINITY_DN124480_c0_g1_i1:51-1247(+)